MGDEGAADQVAHATGLEGSGRLKVFEFEEDAAEGIWISNGERQLRGEHVYHPAALDRAADSINGVETQGLGRSGGGKLPIVEDSLGFLWSSSSSSSGSSRQLKGSCRFECRTEKTTNPPHQFSD